VAGAFVRLHLDPARVRPGPLFTASSRLNSLLHGRLVTAAILPAFLFFSFRRNSCGA
jgi:hypothetical protein